MKNLTDWSRLASAASDARDDLRFLIPLLDRAIAERKSSAMLLVNVQALAIRNAEALRLALKRPVARSLLKREALLHPDKLLVKN